MFATTSGTTGRAKYIPVTPSYLHEYSHGVHVHTYRMFTDFGDMLEGKILVSSSSDEEGHLRRRPALRRHLRLPGAQAAGGDQALLRAAVRALEGEAGRVEVLPDAPLRGGGGRAAARDAEPVEPAAARRQDERVGRRADPRHPQRVASTRPTCPRARRKALTAGLRADPARADELAGDPEARRRR